nr:LamG domain-containing protein [Pirellulales bacterium]
QTYSDVILAGNPLLYWNFNEAGDSDAAIDLVGADVGDNLLAEGNATRVTSASTAGGLFLGRAASFDGTQFSKFYSGTLSPATNPDAWALEMWVRPQGADPGDRFDYLLEARGGGNNRPGLLFDYGFNNKVEVFGGGGRTEAGGPSLAGDAWQHVVIGNFGDANDRIDFYLNGVAAGSVAFVPNLPFGTDQIAVGNSVPGNPDFDHFNGQIDELALYDLSGQSVADISARLAGIASHYSAAVPEPAGIVIFAVAAVATAGARRRRV